MKYIDIYNKWKKDPISYWTEIANEVAWIKFPKTTLSKRSDQFYTWFSDGILNTSYNAIDKNVIEGRGNQVAIYYDSPISNTKLTLTYNELKQKVSEFAGALKKLNVLKQDRVIVYMPNIPEAIIAILAIARIGAVHSVVFGGFASKELAVRIDDCKPKLIISASCGLEPGRLVEYKPLLDEALKLSRHKVQNCIIYQRSQKKAHLNNAIDIDWQEALKDVDLIDAVPVKGSDPLYILYTSGTTGQPKGVVRENAGHLVSLKWSMRNIYGINPGDTFWAASDIGWAVGHSYIIYAPLFQGCSTVLFEGKPVGTPDPGTFWRIINEYKVKCFFTAPTALRAVKKEDNDGKFINREKLKSLKALFLAGERADPDTVSWLEEKLNIPIIDHWWQTETGWPIASNPIGIELLPIKKGSPSVPLPGYEIEILDDKGNILPPEKLGSICIKLPLPPSCLPTLWKADKRFIESYLSRFPGYYETGDAGYLDADGYIYVMSRTDDVINTAGHRLSTGAMEEIISNHKDVAECAVVGIKNDLKGEVPIGLVCINSDCIRDHLEICDEIVSLVRKEIGPVASFKKVAIVNALPKTRSGKILRKTIRSIMNRENWDMPATVEDPDVFIQLEIECKKFKLL